MGLASAQQAYLRTRRDPEGQINPGDAQVPPLPEGWKEELDGATGVHYYVHDDGTRSWVRPNFRPPSGPGGGPPPSNFRGPPPQMGARPPPFQQPPRQFSVPPPQFGQPPPPMHGAP
ncbi:hypothetical protein ACHAXR_007805 [Thalassiosira sp. AJA248-18]